MCCILVSSCSKACHNTLLLFVRNSISAILSLSFSYPSHGVVIALPRHAYLYRGNDGEDGYAFHQVGVILFFPSTPNPLYLRQGCRDAIYKDFDNTFSSEDYNLSLATPLFRRTFRYYSQDLSTRLRLRSTASAYSA